MANYNNPFNLRKSNYRWLGKVTPKDAQFEHFDTMEHGVRAGIKTLITYVFRHHITTIRDIITRYAPSSENDTEKYIGFVSQFVGLLPDTDILADGKTDLLLFARLCGAIAWFESHYDLTWDEFFGIIDKYHLSKYF